MNKITYDNLNNLVADLNKLHPGHDYAIGRAYGGAQLTINKGSKDALSSGYVTKKELYSLIHAYRRGLVTGLGVTIPN